MSARQKRSPRRVYLLVEKMSAWNCFKKSLALEGRLNYLSREFMLFYIYAARIYHPTRKNFLATYPLSGVGDVRMAQVPSFYEYYATFSTLWHIYNITHAAMPELLLPVVGLFNSTNLPNHCFLTGRIVGLPDSAERILSGMLSFFHLFWRASQQLLMRPYSISMVFLMFESETVIEQFLGQHTKPCSRCPQAECTNPNHDKQLDAPAKGDEHGMRDRYLRDILCFKRVGARAGTIELVANYYLRPNRTKEARFCLRNRLGLITVLNTTFCMSVLLITASFAVWMLALDSEYIERYPGCSPDLEFSIAMQQSAPWSAHRLLSALSDAIANFIICFDTSLAFSFAMSITYLMSCDLIFYWTNLSARIEHCLKLALNYRNQYGSTMLVSVDAQVHPMDFPLEVRELSREMENLICDVRWDDSKDRGAHLENKPGRSLQQPSISVLNKGSLCPQQAQELQELERSIENLQSAMCDFFLQVERTDLCLSDIITDGLSIWLISFAVLCVFSIYGGHIPSGIRSLQFDVFFLLTFSFQFLVKLHLMCTGKAYISLCSLIALDHTKFKRLYPDILQFYASPRNRTTFSIAQRVALVPTTYLAILGWSASCYFVFQSLIGKDRA